MRVHSLRQLVQDVAGDENRLPHFLEGFEELAHLDAGPRVEPRRRFIEQQQVGVVQQHPRQREPLLHSPRESVDRRIELMDEVGKLEDVADDGLAAGPVDAIRGGKKVQVLFDRQIFIDAEKIGDVADLFADRLGPPQNVDAVDLHPPGKIAQQGRQNLYCRRLPGPVGPDETEHFPARYLQRDSANGRQLPVADPQAFHVDDKHYSAPVYSLR